MQYEWGPWVEHDGRGCPCVGKVVQVQGFCGLGGELPVETVVAGSMGGGSWDWRNYPIFTKVIRYRIRRPLVRKYLQEITDTLPEMEDA